MKRLQPELVPLLLAAFLAPIIGGQVSIEAMPLTDGFLSGILGGPELPFGARALLGTLVALAFAISLVRRRVVQIPSLPIAALTVALVVLVGLSVFSSEYAYVSYSAWLNWVLYGLCLFATVATVGRRVGVRAMTWAMVAGGTVTALKGIQEYADFRATEPGHRIFADWINPNALAGILGLLIPVALGLVLTSDRLEAIGSVLCTTLMLFALVLTQSKGGLYTTALALVVLAAAGLAWKGRARVARLVAPVALAALLAFATVASSSQPGALTRVAESGTSQEQSVGFRAQLWKGAVQLVKSKPTGYGAGAYRFESARPGLTEQTYHAHQTWLQLAVESSPLAALALLALAFVWTWTLLSGASKWPWQDAGLRAGILAACVAAAADGMLESNLINTGIGIALFFVIGLGLQSSTDGSLPEFTPKNLRWLVVIFGCLLPVVLFWHTAIVESVKSGALTATVAGDRSAAAAALESAQALAPGDGEALYLQSRLQSGTQNFDTLRRAASVMPTTRYLRAYAAAASREGRQREALAALDNALLRDPNNLSTLEAKYRALLKSGDVTSAIKAAESLVAVENTPYFRIRGVPELVPLETYDARVFLAAHVEDKSKKTILLKGAVEGYGNYFILTVAYFKALIKQSHVEEDKFEFLGHNMAEVRDVALRAKAAAKELEVLYRESGDGSSADGVSKVAESFSLD